MSTVEKIAPGQAVAETYAHWLATLRLDDIP